MHPGSIAIALMNCNIHTKTLCNVQKSEKDESWLIIGSRLPETKFSRTFREFTFWKSMLARCRYNWNCATLRILYSLRFTCTAISRAHVSLLPFDTITRGVFYQNSKITRGLSLGYVGSLFLLNFYSIPGPVLK